MKETLVERLRRKPIFFLLVVFILLFYVTPFYYKTPYITFPVICKNASCLQAVGTSLWEDETHPDYVVYTRGCKIMEMNPFDKTVKKFIQKGKLMKCSQRMTKVRNQKLMMDETYVKSLKTKKPNCCYRSIHRVTQDPVVYNKDADFTIKYSNTCNHIPIGPEGIAIKDPFLKVECQGSGKPKGNVEFHGVAMPPKAMPENVKKKTEYWEKRHNQSLPDPPSILVIGIDSISRMHMMRSLPKTREFLKSNDFVEMKGYNKVGENTFPNIMAGFGGMELNNYSSCWTGKTKKVDDCPFLWKNFSDLNYITAFLEDSPGIAIFNFAKLGFVLPPADYYMRPLTVAIHKYHSWYRDSAKVTCVGGTSPTDFQANYITDFVHNMGKVYPYFLFSWFTSIGHDDFNGLKTADDAFHNLLSSAMSNSSANPDNTIVIFMSDHGYRFGNFRETFLGFYEESLPFFFFRLPPSLKEKHPEWQMNMERNSRQLTSPLDLHSTLEHILEDVKTSISSNATLLPCVGECETAPEIQLIDGKSPNSTFYSVDNEVTSPDVNDLQPSIPHNPQYRSRYSWFEYIPPNRTCESSSIPQRYCMCGVTPAVSKMSTLSNHLGDIVVTHVNYMLQSVISSGKCVALKFSKFLYGREVGHGEIWNNFNQLINYKDYLVALEAKPSKAHFESKIRVLQNSSAMILGDITRINSYKGQSDCILEYNLKSFCLCKDLTEKEKKKSKQKRSKHSALMSILSSVKHVPQVGATTSLNHNIKTNHTSSTNRHINTLSFLKKP